MSVTQTAKGYSDHRWATYKQIKDMGGQVRKGEKATHVLFYKFDDEKAQPPPGAPATPASAPEGQAEKEHTRPPMVRCYAVFNVEQADGLTLERTADDRTAEPEWKAHQTAERVIQESGVHVVHVRGDRACYNLQTDTVTIPEREQFATANGYYQTALHELGHATGHPARMDRDTLKHGVGHFGSVEYAREERRAEMSAMMTGERVGVGHDGSRGAAYVQGWIKALEDDPKEIYKAAADAQKISDYLMRPIRRQMDDEEFEAREEAFVARFGGREPAGHTHEEEAHDEEVHEHEEEAHDEELGIVEFLGSDARLQGIEAHADVRLTARLSAEVGLDYVHGQLKNEGAPLPRIPPLRGRVGLRYQVNAFQVGGEVRATTTQDRVSGVEEPTEGYQLLKLFASYSFVTGQTTSTVTARLDNVTDELYRNHLSLIKAHVPERGRNVTLLYNVRF